MLTCVIDNRIDVVTIPNERSDDRRCLSSHEDSPHTQVHPFFTLE